MLTRSPFHDTASIYARSGLFKALSSFDELERRIAGLPTEKERGDAFEVFVEAYLSTDEMVQATDVWVIGTVPLEYRQRLNLPSRDYGYDGVFRTKLGEFVTYQAKFRSLRAPLPYAELATFFGISEKADRRVVLTNSVAISAIAESRASFQTTRGGDFDRLDAAQLDIIATWINGITPAPLLREPRPHQRAALRDIEGELATHDRATVVMACGTGKTLVALWAAESAEPGRVLVLVPSLNLLRQTLHEWAKWTNWGERFRFLCVCSDSRVGKGLDDIEVRPEDADFPVRTDPAIVRDFLDAGGDDVSVVFCTYQSAPVVGEAMAGRQPFDLGIFDEAHKTTGQAGTRFGYALEDRNLPIKKRLFLTATPRHYDIGKRDREGDFAVVSMDDEALYGRVAHRLTFASAAAQRIIVPYKVVISVVDSEMIDNALMDQRDVSIEGDPIRAKWVAHQIALKRAVEEHNLTRIITFHSSIRAAAAFASDSTAGVGMHLTDFQRFHVSGEQPTAERDEHMREFARVPRGVITNARCLTEGVDVPSVDMVAFMNPRRSRVDIVQAVGRAMRTADDGKTFGYVLIPLFLETRRGETIDEALERSDFREIAQVLNAMRENDDELNDIVEALAVESGRTGGYDESRLRDKVEVLGPQLRLAELASAIRIRLVDELSIAWDERYGQLIAYKQLYGDCNVSRFWTDKPGLGAWMHTQRSLYSLGRLSPERVKRLEQLGFVWNTFSAAWEKKYGELVSYKQAFGDCNVPQGWKDNPELGGWCTKQRGDYRRKKDKLSADKIRHLEKLGFIWDPLTVAWEGMFAALAIYKQTHGHCDVPPVWPESPALPTWCRNLRTSFKTGKLNADQIERLEGLGFVWFPYADDWDTMFAALTAYKQARGDCEVPNRWVDTPGLGTWCGTQRYAYKTGRMSVERIARLEELGFVWDPLAIGWEEDWEENFAALAAFKGAYGHCNVPKGQRDKLGDWCSRQRTSYKTRKLSLAQIQRLEQLGFTWDPLTVGWEEMFAALTAYKQANGDCNVPKRYKKGNPKLASWCANQRTAYKQGRLSHDRIARLEQLGFIWDLLGVFAVVWDDGWEKMFAALTAYKQTHGDCAVPNRWKENPRLGAWCQKQRNVYKTNRLPADRIARFEQLGFLWDPLTAAWEQMFTALTAYKLAHGACNVPIGWSGNPKLGSWCAVQRAIYKKGQLDPDRIKRMEQLGFTWRPAAVAWAEILTALTAYKQANGDCNVPLRYEDNQNLGAWCATQRSTYKKGKLDPDRIKSLEQLGFTWQPLAVTWQPSVRAWEEMFSELLSYKAIHGHCNPPQRYEGNQNLGAWCNSQRNAFKKAKLDPDRIKRLEQLGFVLDPHTTAWNEMFAALIAYKQAHGHFKVPKRWKENPALETWCLTQRANYKTNQLSAERVARLEQIGFTWDPFADAWDDMFAALTAHRLAHGDCNAPMGLDGNSKLASWRDAQRTIYKKGKLDPDRIERLADLGFRFAMRQAKDE